MLRRLADLRGAGRRAAALARGRGAGARSRDRHRRAEARLLHQRALHRAGGARRARHRRLGRAQLPLAARRARRLHGRRRGGRRPRAARLRALARQGAHAHAADPQALPARVPPLQGALSAGPRLPDLERGQPVRPADLPAARARGAVLRRDRLGLPRLPHRRRRRARHVGARAVAAAVRAGRAPQAADLGPAQLHRRQPLLHARDARAAADRRAARCGSRRPAGWSSGATTRRSSSRAPSPTRRRRCATSSGSRA